MLVHSSVSGARQWRGLIDDLKSHFQVRAVNLFGYGKTPPWPAESRQSLTDHARLVEAALPAGADKICLVGHSFGGAVAMKVAARLSGRVAKLVLLEPIPFQLLAQAGCKDAFAEAKAARKPNYLVGRAQQQRVSVRGNAPAIKGSNHGVSICTCKLKPGRVTFRGHRENPLLSV
jgi:pimeloyl-ACP methyl ester carboxylesterase